MYGGFARQLNINYALIQHKRDTQSDRYKHGYGSIFDLNYFINGQ